MNIGLRYLVNEERKKLRFQKGGQNNNFMGKRIQRDTSNFQHDMHNNDNNLAASPLPLHEQVNKTVAGRLTLSRVKNS